MLSAAATRLAVWGDPIEHSRSPRLHAAAYRVLGLDWDYGRRRVTSADFPVALAQLDGSWRGLSLTMPLKTVAFSAAHDRDRHAELTGAVNTLLLTADGPRGFNTDVGGIVRELREHGVVDAPEARIVGAGATATSALVALAELGAERVHVVARRAEAVRPLAELGTRVGVAVEGASFDDVEHHAVAVTVATLPGDARIPDAASDAIAGGGGILLDVVYGHWPTDLASAWERAGRRAVSGLGMLLHQALLQVRIFAGGDPGVPLRDEDAVLAAMRDAIVGD